MTRRRHQKPCAALAERGRSRTASTAAVQNLGPFSSMPDRAVKALVLANQSEYSTRPSRFRHCGYSSMGAAGMVHEPTAQQTFGPCSVAVTQQSDGQRWSASRHGEDGWNKGNARGLSGFRPGASIQALALRSPSQDIGVRDGRCDGAPTTASRSAAWAPWTLSRSGARRGVGRH